MREEVGEGAQELYEALLVVQGETRARKNENRSLKCGRPGAEWQSSQVARLTFLIGKESGCVAGRCLD